MGPFPMGSTEGFIVWLNREDCPKDLTECDRIPWVRGIIAAVAIEAIHEHEDRLFSMDPKIVNKATRDWKVAYGNKTPEEAKIEWRAWRDEE